MIKKHSTRIFLRLIKRNMGYPHCYENPTAIIILNSERLNVFPLRSRTRKGCPLLSHLFVIVLKVLTKTIRHEKELL